MDIKFATYLKENPWSYFDTEFMNNHFNYWTFEMFDLRNEELVKSLRRVLFRYVRNYNLKHFYEIIMKHHLYKELPEYVSRNPGEKFIIHPEMTFEEFERKIVLPFDWEYGSYIEIHLYVVAFLKRKQMMFLKFIEAKMQNIEDTLMMEDEDTAFFVLV